MEFRSLEEKVPINSTALENPASPDESMGSDEQRLKLLVLLGWRQIRGRRPLLYSDWPIRQC